MEVFLVAMVIALGWTGYKFVRMHLRSHQITKLLYEDRPEDFLREIDADLVAHAHNKKYAQMLSINKTAGLCYVGRFQEACDLLASFRPDALPAAVQSLYYNNLLVILVQLRRFDDAREVREGRRNLLQPTTKFKKLNSALRGTLAIYELFCGDRDEGKAVLAALLRDEDSDYFRASRLYYLGRVLIEEGHREEGLNNLRLAATLASHSFIPAMLKEFEGQGRG